MLVHNNNKLKGHLPLNGTELIVCIQTRLRSDFALTVAKRNQYLMNSNGAVTEHKRILHLSA